MPGATGALYFVRTGRTSPVHLATLERLRELNLKIDGLSDQGHDFVGRLGAAFEQASQRVETELNIARTTTVQGPNGPEPAVSPQLAPLVEQSVRTAIHKVQAVSSTLGQQLDAHAQAFGRQITSLVERLRGESAEIERRLETSGGAPIPGSGRKGSSAIERSMEAHLAPPCFRPERAPGRCATPKPRSCPKITARPKASSTRLRRAVARRWVAASRTRSSSMVKGLGVDRQRLVDRCQLPALALRHRRKTPFGRAGDDRQGRGPIDRLGLRPAPDGAPQDARPAVIRMPASTCGRWCSSSTVTPFGLSVRKHPEQLWARPLEPRRPWVPACFCIELLLEDLE